MEITCDSCQSKLKIPDEKIPADKVASFACPKCKGKITITPGQEKDPSSSDEASGELKDLGFEGGISLGDEEASAEGKPFQFIEEVSEITLICETDPVIRKSVTDVLTLMEYHVFVDPGPS